MSHWSGCLNTAHILWTSAHSQILKPWWGKIPNSTKSPGHSLFERITKSLCRFADRRNVLCFYICARLNWVRIRREKDRFWFSVKVVWGKKTIEIATASADLSLWEVLSHTGQPLLRLVPFYGSADCLHRLLLCAWDMAIVISWTMDTYSCWANGFTLPVKNVKQHYYKNIFY